MCGIVGYIGSSKAAHYVLEGLRKLEYRGYDSAGIATVAHGVLHVRRRKGKLSALDALLHEEPLQGDIAIGHTRWATHGRPSDENAHPHAVDDVVVVHNGIIENFLELKARLLKEGRVFESDTDTELISHLIAMQSGANLAERVRKALEHVRGAYAIAVICAGDKDTIVVAKNASPLVIGVADDCGVIASDIPALLPYTRDVLILEEGEMATIRVGEVKVFTLEGAPLSRAPKTISWSPVMAEKGGHKHFMHKEIHEQPRALIDTLRGRLSLAEDETAFKADHEVTAVIDIIADCERVVFSACGTSYIACLVGRLVFEELARVGCEVELASELRYRNPLMGPKTALVTVSQSGETADSLGALRASKALGSKAISIVNVIDSTIARDSDAVLYTHAGPEIGVASTKAFITQVASLIMLGIALGERRGLSKERNAALLNGLRHLPRQIEDILQQEERIIEAAQIFKKAQSALFLGRGYGYPVALEGALKLKEISYIHAEGYAAGEMKHGPIALVVPETPSVFVATDGPLYEKVISNLQEVKARDGLVLAIATVGNNSIEEIADHVVYVPQADPMLSSILAAIPLQLLAYHVADQRGTDIDQPRNLAKSVTVE